MKKTLAGCLAVIALFALASSAGAITCTIDQRPAATLLVPYFAATFLPDGNPSLAGVDTIVTIVNASSAPMLAHVNVFNRRTTLVLDFNIALTGFDVQSMRISDVLSGKLPVTGFDYTAAGSLQDACQRNPLAAIFVNGQGAVDSNGDPAASKGAFLRVNPASPATSQDNTQATTLYPFPAFAIGSAFEFQVLDSLDLGTSDSLGCGTGAVDNIISGLEVGYITIDHANYCNLADPTDPNYYNNDAIGMENNLWGEIIFTSSIGIPTYGLSTVNIESDPSFGTLQAADPATRVRTFYARYWDPNTETQCTNCGSGNAETDLSISAPWDEGFGDQREPLGLKWAARWFDIPAITSNFRVWRSSVTVGPADFCDLLEPEVALTFYDEDEESVLSGPCPSPCVSTPFNFPLETNQRNISEFRPLPNGGAAGWVNMSFVNNSTGDVLDQAWVDYSFEGAIALETILVPGTQLDPSSCNPLGVTGIQTILPTISSIPTGTGPLF
jgi:hypothetical protein